MNIYIPLTTAYIIVKQPLSSIYLFFSAAKLCAADDRPNTILFGDKLPNVGYGITLNVGCDEDHLTSQATKYYETTCELEGWNDADNCSYEGTHQYLTAFNCLIFKG